MPILSSCTTQPSSSSNVENLHPQTVRQVLREMTELSQSPPEGVKVFLNEEDITDIQASIEGPGTIAVDSISSLAYSYELENHLYNITSADCN